MRFVPNLLFFEYCFVQVSVVTCSYCLEGNKAFDLISHMVWLLMLKLVYTICLNYNVDMYQSNTIFRQYSRCDISIKLKKK